MREADPLESLSRLLAALYLEAPTQPVEAFPDWAFDRLREAVPFDSALWVVGHMTAEEGPVPHSVHLYRQPAEVIPDWKAHKYGDPVVVAALGRPGTTVNRADPPGWRGTDPELRRHLTRWGMRQTLCTAWLDPRTRMLGVVFLYRAGPRQPFTEAERRFQQAVMPHMARGWGINRMAHLRKAGTPDRRMPYAGAVVDREGVLHVVEPEFARLLTTEYADWSGPVLPGPLRDYVKRTPGRSITGRHVVLRSSPVEDMLLLQARPKNRVDDLSRRQLTVAERYASGNTYRQIADCLCIAPSTVRNHLRAVYAKLGVNNKAAMADLLRSCGV
jgi:DNA-binding CsgD family transcriptional regulator